MKPTPISDEFVWHLNFAINSIDKLDLAYELYDFQELRETIRDYDGLCIALEDVDPVKIKNEFWEICENHRDIPDWLQVFNVKFKPVLNWHFCTGKFFRYVNDNEFREIKERIRLKSTKYVETYKIHSGFEINYKEDVKFHNVLFRVVMKVLYLRESLIKLFDEFNQMVPGQVLQKTETTGITPSTLRIGERKKTDFVKVISAMYDARIFETQDGFIAGSKQAVFDELGKVFNADFSTYSTILSQSKSAEKSSFLKPFYELARIAEAYYDRDIEK